MQELWQKADLTEEIALKFLQMHGYRVQKALEETVDKPQILRKMIIETNRQNEKIELIASVAALLE